MVNYDQLGLFTSQPAETPDVASKTDALRKYGGHVIIDSNYQPVVEDTADWHEQLGEAPEPRTVAELRAEHLRTAVKQVQDPRY